MTYSSQSNGVFQKFVRIDDHVEEIAQEPWSMYWGEASSSTPEFQEFLKDPLPVLRDQLRLPDGYRVQTSIINHDIGLKLTAVCTAIMVFPGEKLVQLILYKHPPA